MRAHHLVASTLLLFIAANSSHARADNLPGENSTTRISSIAHEQSVPASGITNNLAVLSDAQIQAQILALKSEAARRKATQQEKLTAAVPPKGAPGPARAVAKPAGSATGDTARFQKVWLRENGYLNEAAAAPPTPGPPDPCNPQRLFIRANSLDNYLYGITPASKAKGASISYTDDQLAHTQTATINGMVSYVALRDLCPATPIGDGAFFSGYTIAPFVLAQGNYTQPRAKTEHSALQFGVEAQFEISRWFLPRQVFTVTPFAQTDYRGLARASGLKAYWDPYDADLHLGGYIDTNPYLGWFVQLRGEADAMEVSKVGVTNLTNSNYEWVGGTAALNMFFLPADPNVPDFIRNRFAFYASANYFTDVRSGMNIHYYTAKLSYKISPDGSSSVSVEYDDGTQQATLVAQRQYLISLSYAY